MSGRTTLMPELLETKPVKNTDTCQFPEKIIKISKRFYLILKKGSTLDLKKD